MEKSEFTLRAVVLGILLTVVFGAANAYLGLEGRIDSLRLHPGRRYVHGDTPGPPALGNHSRK